MVELLGTHSTQMSFHGVGASGIQTECIISQVSVCVCVSAMTDPEIRTARFWVQSMSIPAE